MVGVVNQNKPNSPFDALPEGLQAVLEEEPNLFNVCLAEALEMLIGYPFWCAWRSPKSLREERGYGTSIALWLGLVGVGWGLSSRGEDKNVDVHSPVHKKEKGV